MRDDSFRVFAATGMKTGFHQFFLEHGLWQFVREHRLAKWKIVGLTHDSASNNTGKSFVEATPDKFRIHCLAHKANNASKLFERKIEVLGRMIDIVDKLSQFFCSISGKTATRLYGDGKEVNVPRISTTRFAAAYLQV
jgi:hypothetical protein